MQFALWIKILMMNILKNKDKIKKRRNYNIDDFLIINTSF
ncbi:hypothetical protein cco10_05718 [Campylobacter coli 90-3]|nr:hypothetical protein cco10_05718 [Campylobacter coli 90-3]